MDTKHKVDSTKTRNTLLTVANILVLIITWSIARTYPLPACIIAVIYFSVVIGMAINRYNSAKTTGKNVSKIKREIIGYAAWIVFLALLLGFQVWSVGGFTPNTVSSNAQSPSDIASQAVQAVKSSSSIPSELDAVTTFTDVTAEGNTIVYHYTLHDADTSNLSDDALRNNLQPTICTNTDTKNLLTNGVDLQYVYIVKETNAQFSFKVSNNNC